MRGHFFGAANAGGARPELGPGPGGGQDSSDSIFREEFNASFVALFSLLLFTKTFHWLSQDRVEYLETAPAVLRSQHARSIALMAALL